MNTNKNNTKNTEADLATALVSGIQKHFSTVPQLTFAGGTLTPSQVEAQLQAFATLRSDVNAARTAMEAKLSAERAKGPALRVFLLEFVSFVRATFGASPDTLADFGLKPKKAPTPLTADEKAAKAAKAKATRAARGTIGKTKKLAISGNVKGIVVTPVTVTVNAPAPPQAAAPAQGATPTNGIAH
jgi:hypothetical protein